MEKKEGREREGKRRGRGEEKGRKGGGARPPNIFG